MNERYAEVRFIPSDLAKDLVLIAEIAGHPAGLGRLVPVDEESAELGGMLVFDAFRGQGVARALIDALIAASAKTIYCIPFAKLESLYAAAGFTRTEEAPAPVCEKYEWCQRTYDEAVLLMERRRRGGWPGGVPPP